MKLWSFLLLIGVCSPRLTMTAEIRRGNYLLDIHEGILQNVTDMGHSRRMDLSNLGLKKITKHVFRHSKKLRSLDISNNQLTDLPPLIFSKLKNLEILSLANNQLQKLDRNFVGLDHLRKLDISNNNLHSFERGNFFGVPKSAEIRIEGMHIGYLESNVFENPLLPTMDSVEDGLDDPDDTIIKKPSMRVSDNFTVKICKTNDGLVKSVEEVKQNETFGDCLNVTFDRYSGCLNLSGLGLRKFQRGWYKLPNDTISKINLTKNNITDITPELLNDLPSGLSAIDLANNEIKIVRRNVINNQYCTALNLNSNMITKIEDAAFEKTKLFALGLVSNPLMDFTFSKTLPTTVRDLAVAKNNMTCLPVNSFEGFKELRTLILSYGKLKTIEPGAFNDQEKLEYLNLDNNEISELRPGYFKGLKMVKAIFLNYNKIKKIFRNTFSELKNSNRFAVDLKSNEINSIESGSFSNIPIHTLFLDFNKISDGSIAKGAFNTSTLRAIFLTNNLMTEIDGDIFTGLPNLSHMQFGNDPVERLKLGALCGSQKNKSTRINFYDTPIKVIQGDCSDSVESI